MVKKLTLVASILVISGCTDKNVIVTSNEETVQLQGTVQSWVCGFWDPWTYPPKPFVERTGEHPTLTVIYTDNTTESFTVDDSSNFSHALIPGPCKIAVTTRFTYPADTFQFYIGKDTTIDFDIILQVLESDTMTILFQYAAMADTQSIASEWATIRLLNANIGGALDANSTDPQTERHSYLDLFPGLTPMYSEWNVPLRDATYNILAVHALAQQIVLADTGSYHHMYVDPKGVYGCEF